MTGLIKATPHDTCSKCGEEYYFIRPKDIVVVFLRQPNCNHVRAECPFCEHKTLMFVSPESALYFHKTFNLELKLFASASDAMVKLRSEHEAGLANARAASLAALLPGLLPEPLPPLPPDLRRSLFDDIRQMERGIGS